VARKITTHFGGDVKIRFEKQYQGDFAKTLCDNQSARSTLGWRPGVGFDEGLRLFLDWFDSNRLHLLTREGRAPSP